MASFGLDIGTTGIAVAAVDEASGCALAAKSVPGPGFLPGRAFERLQDADAACRIAEALLSEFEAEFGRPRAVGLTGQMHGIVYVDGAGRAVSPLYTWQDGRGDLPDGGVCFAERLSRETGCRLSTGYGMITDAWNAKNGERPARAVAFTSVAGYLGMRLTGRRAPVVHASDAAAFGMFDLVKSEFLPAASPLAPEIARDWLMGHTPGGVPVSVAIGDNQAGFIGACGAGDGAVLVNVGTGAQVSVTSDCPVDGVETRPFVNGKYLLVGSSLSGGRAYQALERFFRQCAELAGNPVPNLYEKINSLLEREIPDPVEFETTFSGTRGDPGRRASVRNLTEDNFTPASFALGLVRGVARELHGLYAELEAVSPGRRELVLSGNGVRKNVALRREIERAFGQGARLPDCAEEAAVGAARFALMNLKSM